MKKQLQKIIIVCLLSIPVIANAQFGIIPGGVVGRTNAAIQKIGVGNFPNNASVQAKLHVSQFLLANNPATNGLLFRTDGNSNVVNKWQMFTGTTVANATQKGVLFTTPDNSQLGTATQMNGLIMINQAFNHFNVQSTLGDLVLRAHGFNLRAPNTPLNTPQAEVMRVTRTNYTPNAIDEGRVSISRQSNGGEIVFPLAMLHIGVPLNINNFNNPLGGLGWRPWMDVGTYYSQGTDNMYVGLKNISAGGTEAIINWGNNPSNNLNQGDRLKFIFTAAPSNGNASTANGLEISRMWSDGTEGRTGFGGGAPFNNPFSVTATNDPGNTVEINSILALPTTVNTGTIAPGFGTPTGGSGLRFTDLIANTSIPQLNPGDGVLSVDTLGNVIYVPAGGTGVIKANNGVFVDSAGVAQLGGACNDSAAIAASKFSSHRTIDLNGFHLAFGNGTMGFGTGCVQGARVSIQGSTIQPFDRSGLRFPLLTDTASVQPNNSNKVLSVNSSGDVILVSAGATGATGGAITGDNGISITAGVAQLGVPCTDSSGAPNAAAVIANELTTDRIIAFREHYFWFASGHDEHGGIGVGGQIIPTQPFCNTGNTFEISANLNNPQYPYTSPEGASGLRFTKLTSASETIPNDTNGVNSAKVLTVDGDGDVVLTDAIGQQGPVGPQGPTGATGATGPAGSVTMAQNGTSIVGGDRVELGLNPLLHNTDIPMNNFNLSFTDATITPGGGIITIGRHQALGGKLNIHNEAEYYGLLLKNNITVNTAGDHYGIYNTITRDNAGRNTGTYSVAKGVGAENIGIWAAADGNGGTANYGGYFLASNGSQNIGIYAQGTQWSGYFNGSVNVNGSYYQNSSVFTSDQRFKTNIDTIPNALAIIKQMQPKTFNFDTTNVYGMNFPSQKQYGLIAQQVETILPELVSNIVKSADLDSAGNVINQAITYKALNYNAFIAILMKGMQEQQKTIDSLKNITGLTKNTAKQDSINTALQNQLMQLANTINSCCNAPNGNSYGHFKSLTDTVNQTNVDLNNSQTIVLSQNVPNPFAEQTTINYFLPDNTVKAQMLFYDVRGILIKSVDLIKNGKGALNVFANDLTNGIYTYTLVVDGKIIESKKMVKQ